MTDVKHDPPSTQGLRGVPLDAASKLDVKRPLDEQAGLQTAFQRLPDEIIEQILYTSDPNAFASLIILNRDWRRVSQQAYLYAYHLSRCRVQSIETSLYSEIADGRLPSLRRAFAQVVKRNLFEAYLRPNETIITLVSNSISSSSAFPGGEAFHFSFSPNGHHVLAYSTSRIYVIRLAGQDLAVKRELKILRRPASVSILDDGSILAVLSTDHQVDIYNLTGDHVKHVRAVALDHAPRTISLSPTGSVLAAAYDGGVEVYSIASAAVVADRRAVKCDASDSLSFSQNGTQLLGTTLSSKNPSTVVLTAPYYDPGDFLPEDTASHLWTTSIIFPNSSRDCSHAVLLPNPSDEDSNWTFTYDRVFETFRAVRIDDLRNGTTYFTGPTPDLAAVGKLLPSTLPSSTESGDLVAAGFQGKEIWLYGLPEDLESAPDASQNANNLSSNTDSENGTSAGQIGHVPSLRGSHTWPRDPSSSRIPQWQTLIDKSRNTFIEGRKAGVLGGISAVKWIGGGHAVDSRNAACSERLAAVAPGVVGQSLDPEEESMAVVDGGRICLFDFDFLPSGGKKTFLTIEVGEKEPEALAEEYRDIEAEVAIVRRRTVAQRRENRMDVISSSNTAARPRQPTAAPQMPSGPIPSVPRIPSFPRLEGGGLSPTIEQPETPSVASYDEEQEALDAPYAHGAPRSQTTLRRAATAAAINRRLHPPRIAAGPVEFRRADGREEHPHESDADNWVPPPPPYSREAVPPLPEHLRNAIVAGSVLPSPRQSLYRSSTQRSSSSTDSHLINSLQRWRTTYTSPNDPVGNARPMRRRSLSDSTVLSSSNNSIQDIVTARNQPSETDFDSLYDVSPPTTPPQRPAEPSLPVSTIPQVPSLPAPISQIPRRPVGSTRESPSSNFSNQEILQRVSVPTLPPATVSQPVGPVQLLSNRYEAREQQPRSSSRLSAGSSFLTQMRLDAPVPPRPNENHRMSELPPSLPEQQNPEATPPPEQPTAPAPAPAQETITESTYPQTGLDLPSASQLARLNSRSGRPAVLSDPSRRGSGTFVQPQMNSPAVGMSNSRRTPSGRSPHRTEQQERGLALPHIRYGSHGSPSRTSGPPSPSRNYSPSHTPSSRNESQAAPKNSPSSSIQHLRPRMQRLDTIQSVDSDAGPQTGSMKSSIFRKPSRAERSAAINMQQAKERGWRGTVKRDKRKKRDKNKDTESSTGWTDVSRESPDEEKKGTKCILM